MGRLEYSERQVRGGMGAEAGHGDHQLRIEFDIEGTRCRSSGTERGGQSRAIGGLSPVAWFFSWGARKTSVFRGRGQPQVRRSFQGGCGHLHTIENLSATTRFELPGGKRVENIRQADLERVLVVENG